MNKTVFYWILLLLFVVTSPHSIAQEELKIVPEEESAAVFLEEYTDEFQEKFFEALKQKGIENYDRAINLFLDCKLLNEQNSTLDHELAKAYFLDKQFIPAQQYATAALIGDPENYWYLDTMVQILNKQSQSLDMVRGTIPLENQALKQNLAAIYVKNKKYNEALTLLKNIHDGDFRNELQLKIDEALTATSPKAVIREREGKEPIQVKQLHNPTDALKRALESLVEKGAFEQLEIKAREAVEEYPLQPYFYYAYGLALNKNNKANQALEVLHTGLEYLFEENELSQMMYKELANAYTALGNVSKANEYLSKLKSGL